MERAGLLCVGEAMVDVVAPREPAGGEAVHAPVVLRAGGTPVNAALAARRLGERAAVLARVGADDAGMIVRVALTRAGVDALLVEDPERPTGVFVALGDAIVASRGANDGLAEADVEPLPPHDALLVSGYTLGPATAAAARRALEASGTRWRAVDAGGAPGLEHAAAANVLFATREELERLARPEVERFEVVVVKLGVEGAQATRGVETVRQAPPRREASGQPGAGDALDAGVLVGLARGAPLGEALALGVAAAADVISAN